jgi:hypothetical protein
MMPRLTTRMTIDALFRRVRAEGGFATVIARGDETAGAILLLCRARGGVTSLQERTADHTGEYRWTPCGPQDAGADSERDSYIQRRRDRDPDLWLIELDIPDAERFTAEIGSVR